MRQFVIVLVMLLTPLGAVAQDKQPTTLYKVLEGAFVVQHVVDFQLTSEILKHEGYYEANPILKKAFESGNYVLAGALKATFAGATLLIGRKLYRDRPVLTTVMMVGANYFMYRVNRHNYKLYAGIRIRLGAIPPPPDRPTGVWRNW